MYIFKKTAVIVLDIQNDFCDDQGAFVKYLGWKTESIKAMVPELERFINKMRKKGSFIIFSQMINDIDESPSNLQKKLANGAENLAKQWPFGLLRGSWGWNFFTLEPAKDDIVLEKKYYDLFSNLYLNEILQARGITTIIVTGLYTEVCVFGTAQRAFTEGYNVIVPKDLVASVDQRQQLRNATLEIMENYIADTSVSRLLQFR